jgi:hypothetical protein
MEGRLARGEDGSASDAEGLPDGRGAPARCLRALRRQHPLAAGSAPAYEFDYEDGDIRGADDGAGGQGLDGDAEAEAEGEDAAAAAADLGDVEAWGGRADAAAADGGASRGAAMDEGATFELPESRPTQETAAAVPTCLPLRWGPRRGSVAAITNTRRGRATP